MKDTRHSPLRSLAIEYAHAEIKRPEYLLRRTELLNQLCSFAEVADPRMLVDSHCEATLPPQKATFLSDAETQTFNQPQSIESVDTPTNIPAQGNHVRKPAKTRSKGFDYKSIWPMAAAFAGLLFLGLIIIFLIMTGHVM